MGHCTQSIRNYFTSQNIPIPTAVNQFCTGAEAAAATNESDTSDLEDPPARFFGIAPRKTKSKTSLQQPLILYKLPRSGESHGDPAAIHSRPENESTASRPFSPKDRIRGSHKDPAVSQDEGESCGPRCDPLSTRELKGQYPEEFKSESMTLDSCEILRLHQDTQGRVIPSSSFDR